MAIDPLQFVGMQLNLEDKTMLWRHMQVSAYESRGQL